MRPIIIFIIIFIMALISGSILAWPMYELTSLFVATNFRRVISHTTLLFGLCVSVIYLKYYAGLSFAKLGYDKRNGSWQKQLIVGFLMGVSLLTLIEITVLGLGAHEIDSRFAVTFSSVAILLLKGLITGLVIALIEETIFRGAMYGGLRETSGVIPTIITVSMMYSAVHYLKYPDIHPETVIGWSTGLESLPHALNRFSRPVYYDAMFALFLLGVLFAMLRHFCGNMYSCIGLHTAIVMMDKTITQITHYAAENEFSWLANKYQTTLGYASACCLLLFCLGVYLFFRKHKHVG